MNIIKSELKLMFKFQQKVFVNNNLSLIQKSRTRIQMNFRLIIKNEIIIINMIIIPILLLLIQVQSQTSSSPCICTGQITPIASLPTTTTSIYNASLFFALVNATYFQSGLSLISFHSAVSQQFSFNSSIVLVSMSSITVSATPLSSTHFWLLSLHYMVSYHNNIRIITGCYYCNNLQSGTGPRNQTFNNISFSNLTTPLKQITVISGLKMNNTQGNNLSVTVTSNLNTLPIIQTTVKTDGYVIVQWFCISILIYKPLQVNQVYYFGSFPTNSSAIYGPTNNSMFFTDNVMFFGISAISLKMTTTKGFLFSLTTSNSSNPYNLTTNPNLDSLILEQFFIMMNFCMNNSTGPFFDFAIYNCTTNCSLGTYNDSMGYCQICPTPVGNCITCDQTGCLTCNSTLFRSLNSSNLCGCNTTSYENITVCVLCSSVISNCSTCTSQTFCTLCFSPFLASGGICICPFGLYLSNKNCSTLIGCLVPDIITSGAYCITCDKARNFQSLPNKLCTCINYTIYNATTGMCQGVCGNNVSFGKICDDADVNNTNGCFNNCTVNPLYYCSNPSTTSPSVCVLKSNYTASYLYATKIVNQNTAVLYFNLQPDNPSFSKINFSKYISTTIPNSLVTASYSNNILIVQVTYTQNIEATNQNLTISFNQTLVYAPNITLNFNPCGLNYKLVFTSMEKFNTVVTMIAELFGGLAFIFAIVASVLGYKLIGLEMVLPIQLVYFSLVTINIPSSAMGSLYGLSFSNGYNRMKPFQIIKEVYVDSGLLVLQTNNQFLANFNYMAIPLILMILIVLVSRCWVPGRMLELQILIKGKQKIQKEKAIAKQKERQKKIEQERYKNDNEINIDNEQKIKDNVKKIQEKKQTGVEQKSMMEKVHFFVVDRVLITYWILLLQNCFFSFSIQLLAQNTTQIFFSLQLNVFLALIFAFLISMGLVFVGCKMLEKDKYVEFKCKKRNYPILLIMCYLLSIVVVASFFYLKHNIGTCILIIPSILPIVLIFRMRPYGSLLTFRSIFALLCQTLPITAIILELASNNMSMQILPLMSAFILLAFIMLMQGLAIVALILKIREKMANKKKEESSKNAAKEQNAMDQRVHDSIKHQLLNIKGEKMINWKQQNQNQFRSISSSRRKRSQKRLVDNDEEQDSNGSEQDELLKLKLKLKREIMEKRGTLHS